MRFIYDFFKKVKQCRVLLVDVLQSGYSEYFKKNLEKAFAISPVFKKDFKRNNFPRMFCTISEKFFSKTPWAICHLYKTAFIVYWSTFLYYFRLYVSSIILYLDSLASDIFFLKSSQANFCDNCGSCFSTCRLKISLNLRALIKK